MSKVPCILVVDDEPSICWALERMGRFHGLDVQTASSAELGLRKAGELNPDVVLLDVRLPGMDGLSAVSQFQRRLPGLPIVLMTAYGDLDTAVRAVGKGVFEYVVKPFDLDQIGEIVQQALRSRTVHPVSSEVPSPISGFVGRTPAMQEVYKAIALAASSNASVLITGESGTGKELAARAIHHHSDRKERPFIPVNLASLPPTLAESELFGHVRGAFTGAERDRDGLLVQADGGTLFLDEIADIPLSVQVKLLRVLEEGQVTPVGGSTSRGTRFRIVAATHQELWDAVREGRFRHDLFFRLAAFRIQLPPLRERVDDIPLLAKHFLHALGREALALAPESMEELQSRRWYGNVRELRNVIEHATIVARRGTILPVHFPAAMDDPCARDPRSIADPDEALREAVRRWVAHALSDGREAGRLHAALLGVVESPLFAAVLQKVQGNYRAAADHLGIHRTTLRRKVVPEDSSEGPSLT